MITSCDDWGGAESRGNGARQASGLNDNERHLRHTPSRVPRRSSGRIKGGKLLRGLENRCEWRRCRSLSLTPPASLRSTGSRPRPSRHTSQLELDLEFLCLSKMDETWLQSALNNWLSICHMHLLALAISSQFNTFRQVTRPSKLQREVTFSRGGGGT